MFVILGIISGWVFMFFAYMTYKHMMHRKPEELNNVQKYMVEKYGQKGPQHWNYISDHLFTEISSDFGKWLKEKEQ